MTSRTRIEDGRPDHVRSPPLVPHTSSLPNWLYILSFAPPCPSIIRQPKAYFGHPIVLYSIGTFCALIAGVGLPAFDITFGWWTQGINNPTGTPSSILHRGSTAGWIMAIVGIVFWITFTTFVICFTVAGIKLSGRVREQYLAAVMVQDQAFFDRVGPGEVVTRSSKDIDSIRIGLGERLGYLMWTLSTLISAFVSAFAHSPRLAGVLFCLLPTTAILFTGLGYWTENVAKSRSPMDGQASSFIEQMLTSVRVVQSFDMAQHLVVKLETTLLTPLRKMSTKLALAKSLEQAAGYGVGFLVYSMCFWYGGIDVSKGNAVGNVLTTFYNYLNLFFSFALVIPHLIAVTTAIQNIGILRLQIERRPPIDVRDTSGIQFEKEKWESSFELDRVTFAYPSRPTIKALDDMSVQIPAGRFTAFAGPSGSGKSTLAALLLRLYDPQIATVVTDQDQKILKTVETDAAPSGKATSGSDTPQTPQDAICGAGLVRFAGHDVRDINVRWLRSQVAVVLQNPQLISGTVFDNVVIGLTGTELEYRPDIHAIAEPSPKAVEQLREINELVEDALRKAQAWDFVCDLPDGISTVVFGGRTGVLSGGQVQRVALARALVRRPRCLLLDEATSAVSADVELKIQESLVEEQKRRGMTLIIIAHRLSTLVAANRIIVMKDGRVVHSGKYDDLVDPSCPDSTFRDMAQASAHGQQGARTKTADTTSTFVSSQISRTATPNISNAEKGLSGPSASLSSPIPPPLRSTTQAFAHVKFSLSAGIILGLVAGAAFIIAAWIYGRAASSLSISDIPLMRRTTNKWAFWFLILAIATFIVMVINVFGFENSGERIVSELRRETVRALIKQDIPFFEQESSGTGSLTAAAAHHPQNVGNVVGVVLAQFVSNSSNFAATIIFTFLLSWRVAVMILPPLAVVLLSGYLNFIWLKIFEANIVAEDERQANFVANAVNSAQLIASLTRESETLRQYNIQFSDRKIDMRNLIPAGIALGCSQGVLDLFGALIYYWGAKNVAEKTVAFDDLLSVVESVFVAMYTCAKLLTYTGDFTRMRASLKIIQGWMDREPETGKFVSEGKTAAITDKALPGFVFSNVQLRYPTRPDVLALKGLDVHLAPGRSYAFCGTSGAGKSSILAILQRFYEPTAGSILLDGQDIRSMDIGALRAQMGYVSQEPVLFDGSIRWNLIAGSLHPDEVTQKELEFACEQACILDFIRSLPEGFETDLGMKGGRLSGGQRQRLCIARALLRKPRILLLDEATSALDGQSEAHVQQALDNASRGRLTITIGHRLSAIRAADVIFVMEQGDIVEVGDHEELVGRRAKYFDLVQAQL